MKKYQKILEIIGIERLNNSYLGNPKYYLFLQDEQGEYYRGKTATNASIGYFLGWESQGKKYLFDFHETSKGNLIFDNARKI